MALALSRAIDHLEACLSPSLMSSDPDHPGSSSGKSWIHWWRPHWHTLFAGWVPTLMNSLQRDAVASLKASEIRNSSNGWSLEDTKESTLSLFPDDINAALEAARAHCTDGVISMASRAARSSSASSASAKGRRFEPYAPPRQPFRGGHSRGSGQGRHQQGFSSRGRSSTSSASEANSGSISWETSL